jgi:GT2 family glycosyltransferase
MSQPTLAGILERLTSSLTLVVVGKDRGDIELFQQPEGRHRLWLVANAGREPLSKVANRHLDECKTEVLGLCHADTVFGPGAIEAFTALALEGSVCGIVGVDLAGHYRCSYNDQRDDWWRREGSIVVAGPGPVSTLDSMAVFFRKDLGLRFDEQTFDSFHCHVEDLCLQAHARGIPVTVPAADACHRNHKQSQEWLAGYRVYRARLAEKWKGTEFRTT